MSTTDKNSGSEFDLSRPRYDLNTFWGRYQHFINVTNPITLLKTDAQIEESRAAINRYYMLYPNQNILYRHSILIILIYCLVYNNRFRETGVKTGSDADMWKHKNVVDAVIHPVRCVNFLFFFFLIIIIIFRFIYIFFFNSGDILPAPYRMSAIAPVNIPIVWAMITTPASNVFGTMFLQWLNQSYNTACNYYNRSGSDMSMEQMGKVINVLLYHILSNNDVCYTANISLSLFLISFWLIFVVLTDRRMDLQLYLPVDSHLD